MDISCDSVDPVDIGTAWVSWWLDPYIVGHCYHLDTAQNHRRTQTFIAIPVRSIKNNLK
jgi:hypothetical protein